MIGSNITRLYLEWNDIGDQGACEIANNLVGSNLTYLYLGSNQIGDEGTCEIANNLVGSKLTDLDLIDNEMDTPEIEQLHQLLIDKWNELGNDPEKLIL